MSSTPVVNDDYFSLMNDATEIQARQAYEDAVLVNKLQELFREFGNPDRVIPKDNNKPDEKIEEVEDAAASLMKPKKMGPFMMVPLVKKEDTLVDFQAPVKGAKKKLQAKHSTKSYFGAASNLNTTTDVDEDQANLQYGLEESMRSSLSGTDATWVENGDLLMSKAPPVHPNYATVPEVNPFKWQTLGGFLKQDMWGDKVIEKQKKRDSKKKRRSQRKKKAVNKEPQGEDGKEMHETTDK